MNTDRKFFFPALVAMAVGGTIKEARIVPSLSSHKQMRRLSVVAGYYLP